MKYRLERLNQVQYADDELRRKELEAKGFRVVGGAADSEKGSFEAENSMVKSEAGSTEKKDNTEQPAEKKKAKKNPKTVKKTEPEEEASSVEEAETAEAEVKDAG